MWLEILIITGIVLFTLYISVTAIFLIMENRTPHTTFAWMLLLFIFPPGGLLIYLFFGRDWKAFSRANKLVKQEIGSDLDQLLTPRLAGQDKEIAKLEQEGKTTYKKKLLKLMRHNSNSALTVHNHLEILQNAKEKYPRLVEDIKNAKHSIHLQYYVWASDSFTEQLKSLLIEKVAQGVEVRLLYDPIGSLLELSWSYIREMRAGGVKMYPFSPIYLFHTIGYRNHRKIAVIDGQIGYVGGINIGQEHLDGGLGFEAWRDTHLRLIGHAVTVLQEVFVVDWHNATSENLSDAIYFPPIDPQTKSAYLPVQIITSGPDSQWQAIKQLYFFMILAAEDHVYLQSPFFIVDTSISEALKAAALSGVEVKLMLTPRGSGSQIPYWAANTYIQKLAEAGVRIFFYQKGYFHPKTLNIDAEICSIGSANMDIRSFSINYEVNTVIYDENIAQQLEQAFLKDLDNCVEFNLEEYDNRNFFLRLRDSIARLFSPLL